MRSKNNEYAVLWPRGRKVFENAPLAKRPESLEGKTVCELWDGLFQGDKIFSKLREGLLKRCPGLKYVPWTEFPRDGDHGFPDWENHPHLLAEKGCDMVIAATGA